MAASSPYTTAIPKERLWSKWLGPRDGAGGSDPRSLEQLLKQVEKATQVRRAGTEQVLAELKLHRETTPDPELRSALAWLYNALSRLAKSSSATHSREVLMAADAVKRAAG
jgi:hypothetical protein